MISGPLSERICIHVPTLKYRLLSQGQYILDPDDLSQKSDYLIGSASLIRLR